MFTNTNFKPLVLIIDIKMKKMDYKLKNKSITSGNNCENSNFTRFLEFNNSG